MRREINEYGNAKVLSALSVMIMVVILLAGVVFLWAQSFTEDAGFANYDGHYEYPEIDFVHPENYEFDVGSDMVDEDGFVDNEDSTPSFFGADVDTGSYSLMRSYVKRGELPPTASVRPEEFINYFDHHYHKHSDPDFMVHTECGPSLFDPETYTLKIGIKARTQSDEKRSPSNLMFLIDVSGSMSDQDKLPMIKDSLLDLVGNLMTGDKISIVTYSDSSKILLAPTDLEDRSAIENAIYGLGIEGSTNVEEGIRTSYQLITENYLEGGSNRILLLSDGVANQGIWDVDGLIQLIKDHSDRGVYLSTFGFGMNGYNDELME